MDPTVSARSSLPAPSIRPVDEHAMDLIIRLVKQAPGEITVCAVGPLTNLALALTKAPEIATLARKIVMIGSTLFRPGILGARSPMVDANVNNDPEAARIVLNAGADLVLVGMDVTRRALLTEDDMREIVDKGDDAAKTLMKITQFYLAAYKQRQPHFGGCPLSDPLAVAVCEDPSLVMTERMFVDVELHGELSRGQVIPDRRHTSSICSTPTWPWTWTQSASCRPSSSSWWARTAPGSAAQMGRLAAVAPPFPILALPTLATTQARTSATVFRRDA